MSEDLPGFGVAPREAACLADVVEAQAFTDLYAAAPAGLRASLGLQVRELADATALLAPGLPSAMFNRVIGWGMRRDADLDGLETLMSAYREAGGKTWWLHWSPFAAPPGMPTCLQSRGFAMPARRSWAKMLRGITPPPGITTDLGVATATDDQADAVTRVIAQTSDMPAYMAEWMRALHGRARWRVYAVTDIVAAFGWSPRV